MPVAPRLAVLICIASCIVSTLSAPVYAQNSPCIRVDRIAKWEILDAHKTLVYDARGESIAFIDFHTFAPDLRKGSPTFRFFSPSICKNDDVQINGNTMSRVVAIKLVRKQ